MPRPRNFDEPDVLDRAMDVFWRHGYDGASMAALARAMKLAAPSIYAAFGSKRGLFDAVLARYRERRDAYRVWLLAGPTARDVAERMLLGAVDWLTDPAEPPGCLLFQAGLSTSPENAEIPCLLEQSRAALTASLTTRFDQARRDGDLAQEADPAALARYLMVVFTGLAIAAAAGTPRPDLATTAERALRAWP